MKHYKVDISVATFLGTVVGGTVAFFLMKFWVFEKSTKSSQKIIFGKFIVGVALIMLLNVVFVSFFHHICGISSWPSRILAACAAWGIGYFFNKKVVFA